MKSQLSITTLGLLPVIAFLAVATIGQPFSVHSLKTVQIAFAGTSDAPAAMPCPDGVPGRYSKLHHGWVCSTELAPLPNP